MKSKPAVENNQVLFWLEEGILHFVYKKDCILSIENVKELVQMRLSYQEGEVYKALVYLSLIKTVTPEARQYLAKEGSTGISKAALIIKNPFTTMLGNLYISFNKPLVTTKIFTNKEHGLKWLKKE
jgi:hypothetical protein